MIVNGCLIFVLLVTSMAGEVRSDLYVSTDGKDSNPGTIESPLQTVQHAADIAKPGTTTYIRGGVYCQQLTIHSSGTLGKASSRFEVNLASRRFSMEDV